MLCQDTQDLKYEHQNEVDIQRNQSKFCIGYNLKIKLKLQKQMKTRTFFRKAYLKIFQKIGLTQTVAPPLIFFLLFLYFHLFKNGHSQANTYLLSFFPFTIYATLNFNFMFMTADFIELQVPFAASIIFLVTLSIGCNQKWKTFIFLFNVGDLLSRTSNFGSVYLFLASALFCHEIYYNLTCRTLKDNQKYFTGFFAIAIYGAINFLQLNLNFTFSVIIKAFLIIISGLYAYHLFRRRLQKINKMRVGQIKDSRILAFYLTEFQKEVRTQYVKESKFTNHKRQCTNIHCFCNHKEVSNTSNFFLRQLYENSIKKFPQSCDTLLYEYYIDFLLQNELVVKALYFLKKWNHDSHYTFIAKLKCIQKIKNMFADQDSSNLYEKEYKYALKYDEILLHLTMEIYQVLELKLNFWRQSAKQTPMMIKLQEQGLKIVDKMYKVNMFYNEVIKKYEKKLYCFDATILYAMYLLSTTNFKQYAELIIKNTSKVLEETQILQNNSSQTYAIKTVILQQGLYYIKDISTELQYTQTERNQRILQKGQYSTFKIVIDNACSSFCKLVKINKEQLVGQELNQLIPNGYKYIHRQRLLKILDFQSEELGDIVSSKHFHKNTKLPIKIGINGLIMSYISIKTMVDIEKGSSFVSVIKKMDEKTINGLATFQGQLSQREEGFNQQILMHSEFRKYMKIAIDRWNHEKIIKQQRFNVMINAMNFCIIINSPLAKDFIDNFEALEKENIYPPLHIEIVNESSTKNRGTHANNHEKLVKEFKHMQNAINHDSQSSSSSKNSSAAINILSTFSEKESVPIYRNIIIGFIFVITCCLIVSMIGYLVCNIAWDNTNINSDNPLNVTMNFMKLQHLTANILLNLWDVQEYQANTSLNQSEIKNYFNSWTSYLQSIDTIFKDKFIQFQKYLYSCLKNPSSILSDQLNSKFYNVLTISNMSVIPTTNTFRQQNITFQSLMVNYLIDLSIMSRGIYDDRLLIPSTYSQQVIDLQSATNFGQIIDQSIDTSLKTSLILAICMGIMVFLLLVPMFFFLRSRLPMHEKIFDLFASIESDMVIKQIKSLTYINNIIKNYGQSSEILKTNVLQYQENAIYPKRGSSRKSSVTNEIVIGLQKFDMTEEISPSQSRPDKLKGKQTERSNFKNRSKRKSHITNYSGIKQYIDMKKTLQKRKRAGDLDFTGSESDPQMRINKKHIVIYIMTLVFVIFLSLEVTVTQKFGIQMKIRKNNLMNLFDSYTGNQLSFLLGKLYLRNGNAALAGIDPRYGLQYLLSDVQSIPTYDYTNYYGYDFAYQNCSFTTKDTNISYLKTVCMYNYSYLILLGQFGTVFKQLFEARYNADQNYGKYVSNNQTNIYKQIITNISEKTFYLQSVDNQIEAIVYNIADFVYQDMLNYTKSVNFFKLSIFITSVCWWFVTAIVGIIIILNMKRQYFKEVYMLTFLNNQMILNNKRVESFLDSINKSSSN